jgi:hypothetical protein
MNDTYTKKENKIMMSCHIMPGNIYLLLFAPVGVVGHLYSIGGKSGGKNIQNSSWSFNKTTTTVSSFFLTSDLITALKNNPPSTFLSAYLFSG